MEWQLRPARRGDIPFIVGLLAQLFAIEKDFSADAAVQSEGLRRLLEEGPRNLLLVAETTAVDEAQVIGFCSVQRLISTAEGGEVGLLEDLVVDEAWRGRGIGGQLLKRSEAWCREQGLLRLQLLADMQNGKALDFYRRDNWMTTQLQALRKYP